MRYKQRRRKSSLVTTDETPKGKVNGKVGEDISKSEEKVKNVKNKKINNKNNNRKSKINDSIEDINDHQNEDQIKDETDDNQINGKMDDNINENQTNDKMVDSIDTNKEFNDLEENEGKPPKPPTFTQIIKESDEYFSSLIDLIPAKIYFEGNEEILESMEKRKRNVFGDDLDLSKKSKQKRFKLDPKSNQKISEIANNFYKNKQKSKTIQSKDQKMAELKKKLDERIMSLKSKRGQKRKNLRESKKERKKLNSMRASKQKGFSKRKFLESNDTTDALQSTSKTVKSKDTTDGLNSKKESTNLPKIYNKEGNIVYSKFDLISPSVEPMANNKGSKKQKLEKLLAKTQKEEQKLSDLEKSNAPKAKEIKEKKLWRKAIDLSEGNKVRDNSKLIKRSLNKKKKEKQKSAKKWKERNESLQKNIDSKNEKRNKNIKDRKQQQKDKKLRKMKKRGHILDMN